MSDDPVIPADLLELQRALFAAQQAKNAASEYPGPVADWPEDARNALSEAERAERETATELNQAVADTPFADYRQRMRLEDAARED